MRIDKFLVNCGIGSRNEVKKLLKSKQITVNGEIVTSPKTSIDENHDEVTYSGNVLKYEAFVYYMLNKPKGVISATEDSKHSTVLDLLDETARQKNVFPVGRLDIDTHGLLLLTNNGQLAHAMLSPKKHVKKSYWAEVEGIMDTSDISAFSNGIALKDFICQPAELIILNIDEDTNKSQVQITIHEGKYHQVKRMVASRDKKVLDLKRLTMGPLTLDDELNLGEYRRLSPDELEELKIFQVKL